MFWQSLGLTGQIFFVIACIGSALLLVQLIMLIVGMSTDLDLGFFDADDDGGIGMFTLKGMMALIAVGGWSAVASILGGVAWGWAVAIFFATGSVAMIGVGFAYKFIGKLQSNGAIEIVKAVGHKAEVYLKIPAKGDGRGKITILLQERLVEFDAVTNSLQAIPTGAFVKVVEVLGELLVVEAE